MSFSDTMWGTIVKALKHVLIFDTEGVKDEHMLGHVLNHAEHGRIKRV